MVRQSKQTGKEYEMVIGAEVHVELATATKIFCGCPCGSLAEPNTNVCPACMGLPGTLPVLNEAVVEYAIRAGLKLNCDIAPYSKLDRKNYFYPDLPKAYQISQFDMPLCENGFMDVRGAFGEKRIEIDRIHIEEDAGKLLHGQSGETMIDHNRCGVPLIEIVSRPDIRSGEEAVAYLRGLRTAIMAAGVSHCRMNEGQFRCDINLSVRKAGAEKLGTRVEMKNLNSFRHIRRAIDFEFARQVEELLSGVEIIQETRRFDEASGRTLPLREKEDAGDYRYFPDPDLPPIIITQDIIQRIKDAPLPPLG
jgi:aspartyl-tRNA(Asn)/glutamyl-tRNA(Gln) amidotransferase subunit B